MNTIFLPLLIQVGLTLAVLSFVPRRRIRDIKADPTLLKRAATDNTLYAEDTKQVANNFANQFQLPVLFYVAAIFAILFGATGPVAGFFAWAFVLVRIVHTYIHCSSNNVRLRFYVFAASLVLLIGFWIVVIAAAPDAPLLNGAHPLAGMSS